MLVVLEELMFPEITWLPEKVFVPEELMFPDMMLEPDRVLVPDRVAPPDSVTPPVNEPVPCTTRLARVAPSPEAFVWKFLRCTISSRMALFIPEGAQPSSMLIL